MRSLVFVALLAWPAQAQQDRPVDRAVTPQADVENVFYRAFYLNRGERRYDDALALYEKFLEAAPHNRFADRAVRDAVAILNRAGKQEEADKLRARYGADAGAARADEPAAERRERPRDAGAPEARPRGPAADRQQMTDEQKASLRERIADLKTRLADAEQNGEDRDVQRLTRQIERAERQLESGVMPPPERGDRGQRGGRQRVNFAEMSDDQIAGRLERMERFQGAMLDRLRENGQGEQADKIEKQWTSMKKLLDEGKKDDAQKIYDEIMTSMRRRRG